MYRHKRNRHRYYKIKHLTDIFIGFILSVLMIPLFLIIGISIVIEDGFPVIFKQKRFGINRSFFEIYKFRTMKRHTPHDCPTHLLNDPDQYLTKVGRFLRQYSLDELPQFYNVLKGDMSLVGTRPPTVDEYEQYTPEQKRRLSFKPGITGLWQVSGRSEITDFDEVVRLDVSYIDGWTIWSDIKILLKTIKVVFKRDGAK